MLFLFNNEVFTINNFFCLLWASNRALRHHAKFATVHLKTSGMRQHITFLIPGYSQMS